MHFPFLTLTRPAGMTRHTIVKIFARRTFWYSGNRGGKSIKKLFQPQKGDQFGSESVVGGEQSCTGDIALEDIVRSEIARSFDVRWHTHR
jgi:hypothetical protein